MAQKQREYIIVIDIRCGLITLVDPAGFVGVYRQRGIGNLSDEVKALAISKGLLASDWKTYKELPKHWSIYFEDESVQGKAKATYGNPFKSISSMLR